MSPSVLETAETQWLSQLRAMREAIADLKLPSPQPIDNRQKYGHDITLDDIGNDDLSSVDDFEDDEHSYGYNIEDQDLYGQPDSHKSCSQGTGEGQQMRGPDWLLMKCFDIAQRQSGMDAEDLQQQILMLLRSNSNGALLTPSIWRQHV